MDNKTLEVLYFKNTIVGTINALMYEKGWTIKKLSDRSELPYDSVKKLVGGKINNPTIYSLIKICTALNCSLDSLVSWESVFHLNFHSFPQRTLTLLREMANFEMYLSINNQQEGTKNISVLVPTGVLKDGMIFDSTYYDSVDISEYMDDFGESIICGFKITGIALHPTYLQNDILLIARDRYPHNGENGIFIINKRVYIRTYTFTSDGKSTKHTLLPVNGIGSPIVIDDINTIHFFGRIVTIVRNH